MRNSGVLISLAAVMFAGLAVHAGDDFLWGWSISAGGNFGFGLKTKLRTQSANAIQAAIGPTREAAMAAVTPVQGGDCVVFGSDANGDYYVDPESSWGETAPNETTNWRLPESRAVRPPNIANGSFVMNSGSYVDVEAGTAADLNGSDRDVAYGASIDFSHMIYENEDGTWGIDVSFGLAWMRANNCYKNHGILAGIEYGDIETTIPAECLDDPWGTPEDDNTWGAKSYYGSAGYGRTESLIFLDRISSIPNAIGSDPLYVSAYGDYEEWEISALLKPWYDVTDWLCLHGILGVGVSRSSFEYAMSAVHNGRTVYRSSQQFDEWQVYGIAGAGFLLRAGDFDISCDGMFRWLQQDMEINGKDVNGTLEKPWGVLRVGVSYIF